MANHSIWGLPGKPHIQGSLVVYSPQGCKESDTTKERRKRLIHTKV